MPRTKAALLDVDGTLVDSNDAHAHAWVRALAELGYDAAYERVRALIGKGGDKLLPETIGVESDSREGKKITARRAALFEAVYLPKLRAFVGARPLLVAMKARGLKLTVATSAKRDEVAAILEMASLGDLIDEAATASDANDSKPDPDIVAAALRSAGCDPSEAIMLGDTPYDVEAATRAGVAAVALRCGGWSDDALAGAAAIYDDPRDLLAHLGSSPFEGSRTATSARS